MNWGCTALVSLHKYSGRPFFHFLLFVSFLFIFIFSKLLLVLYFLFERLSSRKKFSPFHVPVTKSSDLDNLYENFKSSINFKIDRAVGIDRVSGNKTPEDTREEYCGAYTTYFEDCDLSFLIPGLSLEILTELGLVSAQMCLNFLSISWHCR